MNELTAFSNLSFMLGGKENTESISAGPSNGESASEDNDDSTEILRKFDLLVEQIRQALIEKLGDRRRMKTQTATLEKHTTCNYQETRRLADDLCKRKSDYEIKLKYLAAETVFLRHYASKGIAVPTDLKIELQRLVQSMVDSGHFVPKVFEPFLSMECFKKGHPNAQGDYKYTTKELQKKFEEAEKKSFIDLWSNEPVLSISKNSNNEPILSIPEKPNCEAMLSTSKKPICEPMVSTSIKPSFEPMLSTSEKLSCQPMLSTSKTPSCEPIHSTSKAPANDILELFRITTPITDANISASLNIEKSQNKPQQPSVKIPRLTVINPQTTPAHHSLPLDNRVDAQGCAGQTPAVMAHVCPHDPAKAHEKNKRVEGREEGSLRRHDILALFDLDQDVGPSVVSKPTAAQDDTRYRIGYVVNDTDSGRGGQANDEN